VFFVKFGQILEGLLDLNCVKFRHSSGTFHLCSQSGITFLKTRYARYFFRIVSNLLYGLSVIPYLWRFIGRVLLVTIEYMLII
jgi:hypothetical protein